MFCFLAGQTDRGTEEPFEPFGREEGDDETWGKVSNHDPHQVTDDIHRKGQRRSSEVGPNHIKEKERLRCKCFLAVFRFGQKCLYSLLTTPT